MSVQVRRRRDTAANVAAYTGPQGEIVVDTTNNRVVLMDGATAGGIPLAKLSEIVANARTAVVDASYAALPSDRTIAYTSLTAARTLTLPAASAYPTGTSLLIVDESGACSPTNAITLAAQGSDTIAGAFASAIATAHGFVALQSNGVSQWTMVGGVAAATPVVVTTSAYTITEPVGDILVNYAGAVSITLPSPTGWVGSISVIDISGAAQANPITIVGAINGATNAVMSRNNEALTFHPYSGGWYIK